MHRRLSLPNIVLQRGDLLAVELLSDRAGHHQDIVLAPAGN